MLGLRPFSPQPVIALARATFLSNVRSLRFWVLVAVAALPTLLIIGIGAGASSSTQLVDDYESITQAFLPLVLLIVTLLLAVPLFRDEIDRQTISYLVTRTIGKPRIVLGKYLGALTTGALVVLVPVLVGYGYVAASAGGSTVSLTGVLPSLLAIVLLGLLVYTAFFLLVGLLFRKALILGILYAFFWEEFVGDLPGSAPEITVRYYLLSIPTYWASPGPLVSSATVAPLGDALGGPVLAALVALFLAVVGLLYLSLSPASE